MTAREAMQLSAAALIPLGLVGLMLAALARQRGRSRRQIALGLGGIAACLLGVIGTGVALSALRGGPLFEFAAGAFSFDSFRAPDLVGLAVCAACLLIALRLSKWLTGGGDGAPLPDSLPPEGRDPGAPEG